ncbi:MAG: FtsQ-type POTRA domain-containing protein [Chloroflexota bacterium]
MTGYTLRNTKGYTVATSVRQTTPRRKLRRQPAANGRRRMAAAAPGVAYEQMVPRTARRRRWRNNSRVRPSLLTLKRVATSGRWFSLALLALCVASLLLIGLDEDFYLTQIPVEGVSAIPPAEIVAASGLAGAHIFAVNPAQAAEAIGDLPGVISATVTLNWPNQAHIRVGEDAPLAVWEQAGQRYWVGQDGRLIPARLEVTGLLLIRSEAPPAVEELGFVPPDVLAGALQLRQLRPNIDRLTYRPANGLVFQDGRGWQAYFGTGTNMRQKLVVYETLVEELLARQVTPDYVSVSKETKPYYRAR